ncbi:hypothetical protein LCGC14_0564890 [marine sediment metagenome]|uniref:Uncharacterized protein n=1 Tax=marine sediment metagenome TaxID=412755 RepID=A0A0F9U7A3_9ZZZZ
MAARAVPATLASDAARRGIHDELLVGGRGVNRYVSRVNFDNLPILKAEQGPLVWFNTYIDLDPITAADVFTFTPGFAGAYEQMRFVTEVAGTGSSSAITFNIEIGSTNVSGGTLVLILADTSSVGEVGAASSAVTGNNVFTSTDVLTLEAATVTDFTAGEGIIQIGLRPASNNAAPYEIAGTNMTAALVTWDTEGGIKLATATADNDQAILSPNTDVPFHAHAAAIWQSDDEPAFECLLRTDALITCEIWAGMRETAAVLLVTDDDKYGFMYDDQVNSGTWGLATSIAGTDVVIDSGITVVADTWYQLAAFVDDNRFVHWYIGVGLEPKLRFVGTSASAVKTAETDQNPFVGVQDNTGAAKLIRASWIEASKRLK